MSWTYEQLTGNLFDPSDELQGKGYSGQPPYSNDPAAQNLEGLGPIPQGLWRAVELIPESTHGPFAIRLEPYETTETFGRSGFLMHGERVTPPPGYASDGCIIQSRDVRERFWDSTDHDIQVVASLQSPQTNS
jgi:hypothetical protein